MRRRLIRPLVLACATLAVSALGTAAVDYTNLLARTDSFLSAFGLDPSEPIVRRPYRNPIPEDSMKLQATMVLLAPPAEGAARNISSGDIPRVAARRSTPDEQQTKTNNK